MHCRIGSTSDFWICLFIYVSSDGIQAFTCDRLGDHAGQCGHAIDLHALAGLGGSDPKQYNQ